MGSGLKRVQQGAHRARATAVSLKCSASGYERLDDPAKDAENGGKIEGGSVAGSV